MGLQNAWVVSLCIDLGYMIIIDPGTQSVVEKGNMNFSISPRESE